MPRQFICLWGSEWVISQSWRDFFFMSCLLTGWSLLGRSSVCSDFFGIWCNLLYLVFDRLCPCIFLLLASCVPFLTLDSFLRGGLDVRNNLLLLLSHIALGILWLLMSFRTIKSIIHGGCSGLSCICGGFGGCSGCNSCGCGCSGYFCFGLGEGSFFIKLFIIQRVIR